MNMPDQDWLDQRLSAESYLPDNGFTARVVGQLPPKRRPVFSLRTRILACSAVFAFCLFLLQMPPLVRTVEHLIGKSSNNAFLANLGSYLPHQQPAALCVVIAVAALLSVGSLPLLKRWV